MEKTLENVLLLQEQGKLREEIRDILGFSVTNNLTKFMKRRNYEYINNKYIKMEKLDKSQTSVCRDKSQTNDILEISDNSQIINIQDSIKSEIIEIVNMKNDLKEIINWFKSDKEQTNVQQIIEVIKDEGLKIDLPKDENIKVTFRANKTVISMFDEVCKMYPEYHKQDMVSMALLHFVKQYSKKEDK